MNPRSTIEPANHTNDPNGKRRATLTALIRSVIIWPRTSVMG